MAGQILGDRYQVEKQLGKKSGRWTLLAQDLISDQAVILKLISMDDTLHPDMLKLFEREVNTLKSLDHSALPKFLDYFEIDLPKDQKALVLVQSYIEGVSIDKYLQRGQTFTEPEARRIAKSILKILIYLHDHAPPVIHRDIKPSNILLVPQPSGETSTLTQICLVDFGSVQSIATQRTRTTILTLVGSEHYMAPEQLSGRAIKASDLYSVGITMLTLLTGSDPTDFPRIGNTFDVDSLTTTTPEFNHWISEMISIDLTRRFSSAQDALAALRTLPRSRSSEAQP